MRHLEVNRVPGGTAMAVTGKPGQTCGPPTEGALRVAPVPDRKTLNRSLRERAVASGTWASTLVIELLLITSLFTQGSDEDSSRCSARGRQRLGS